MNPVETTPNTIRSIWHTGILVLALAGLPVSSAAQDHNGPRALAFEVVSIKPVTGPTQPSGPQTPGRYRNQDATLRTLVAFAYELPFSRIAGGPEWIATLEVLVIDSAERPTPN